MNKFFLFRWFKDVPIAKKLYFTVGIMALLISVELFALFFSLNTLSSLRAYVGAKASGQRLRKMPFFIYTSMVFRELKRITCCLRTL
jgi:hypothetical protein